MNERERLIEILSEPIYPKEGVDPAEVVADYLLDNGVIVPPCKVGDTVYCIRHSKARKPFVKPLEICSIISFGAGKLMVFTTKLDTWGVTAFATKAEAEKALAERGKQ